MPPHAGGHLGRGSEVVSFDLFFWYAALEAEAVPGHRQAAQGAKRHERRCLLE